MEFHVSLCGPPCSRLLRKKNSSFTVPDWWKETVLFTKLSFLSCSFFPQWKHAQKPIMKPKGKQEISWHHTQEAILCHVEKKQCNLNHAKKCGRSMRLFFSPLAVPRLSSEKQPYTVLYYMNTTTSALFCWVLLEWMRNSSNHLDKLPLL